jgi:hypothetical protein
MFETIISLSERMDLGTGCRATYYPASAPNMVYRDTPEP